MSGSPDAVAPDVRALFAAYEAQVATTGTQSLVIPRRLTTFKAIDALEGDARADIILLAAQRADALRHEASNFAATATHEQYVQFLLREEPLHSLMAELMRTPLASDPQRLDKLCEWMLDEKRRVVQWLYYSLSGHNIYRSMLKSIEKHSATAGLTPTMERWLKAMLKVWSNSKPDRARLKTVRALLGEERGLDLHPGEAWSDAAIESIGRCDRAAGTAWSDLIAHCAGASGSAPTAKWMKAGRPLLDALGQEPFRDALLEWFPLVDKPRTRERRRGENSPADAHLIIDAHMEVLKGLCWLASTIPDADLARALSNLAISAYRKVPGIGPRAVKVGNAAVCALGLMPGRDALGQLAMLRVKVKFGTAQKGIDKALTAAAEREGLPRDEIEELGVPTYGLTEVGAREEPIGDCRVRLEATGIGDTALRFFRPDGKEQKSAPAAIKGSEELKELKAAAKDIGAMLPAQRDRLDSLFLENKRWPAAVWRERYLDHPLVGVLARRLVWRSSAGGREQSFAWLDGRLVDAAGREIGPPADDAVIRLWHPIDVAPDEVLGWRRFFEDREIRQPFKQAHREIYLLTDAERNTGTYSNRYAAHIIRQHQFHALCGVRNWKNKLRLMVDAEYPPASRPLPAWGLRAEFWIEGAGHEPDEDANEAGAYHRLSTDQVRFYEADAATASAHAGGGGYGAAWGRGEIGAGLSLETIPPVVFSEIMRDVDLFVGVCSVGNNPEWADGGPRGTFRTYWWDYSFGDLTGSGSGRKDLLSRLLPRLKIGPVCSLADKFLIVKGKLRTYKIHLGSGNILMEPNDQYLCIVASSRDGSGGVFLPFEGDRTLSIILSKAFLLAEDDKIKDPSITHQIGRR